MRAKIQSTDFVFGWSEFSQIVTQSYAKYALHMRSQVNTTDTRPEAAFLNIKNDHA